MKDIELPPLPVGILSPIGELYTDENMHAYARAAVEADRAQRVPDWWKPASGMTAHRAAFFMDRFKREEKLLGPNEQAAIDFVLAMLASTPAPAQQEASGYGPKLMPQVSGYGPPVETVVSYTAQHQEPPQQERTPMTDAQAVKCIEAAGFKTWTSAHFRLVRQAERHHGIKE